MPRVLGGSEGGGRFLMGEEPLYGTAYRNALRTSRIRRTTRSYLKQSFCKVVLQKSILTQICQLILQQPVLDGSDAEDPLVARLESQLPHKIVNLLFTITN